MTTTEYIRLYDDDCIEIDLRPRVGVRVIRIYRGKAYREAHKPSNAAQKLAKVLDDAKKKRRKQ